MGHAATDQSGMNHQRRLKPREELEESTGPRRLTRAHADLRRQQQSRAAVIPLMGMDASMVPPCHSDGDLRDVEPQTAKPLPGENRCQPKAAGAGEGWRRQQDRASSVSTFPAAGPGEARQRPGHSPSGSSGLGEHPGVSPHPSGHCPGSSTGLCWRADGAGGVLPPPSSRSCAL